MMKHGNPAKHWEKVVNRFSPDAIKAYEIFKCKGHLSCLPVDRNRILFVTCKDSYRNKKRYRNWSTGEYYNITYGDDFRGDNKVSMRCPLDCAVVGSAWDNDKRYNEIKERTKGVKLRRPVTEIWPTLKDRILNWFRNVWRSEN